jgi:S1-C subfamily serine protease
VLFTLGALWTYDKLQPAPQNLTQDDLDDAVLQTWNTHVMPSEATRAYQRIRGSVVMVRGLNNRRDADKPDEHADHDHSDDNQQDAEKPNMPDREARGIGTGVVLVDDGVILTNLHVVSGSPRIEVIFADGTKSPARVIEIQRENDLAVLKAMTVPENLPPATVRSSSDLQPGDKVIAVGFPFGIGPSVSSGIVSGLKRQFSSADGEETLKNLIQFDASANPGNSGGPLVTMDGSVVGIVTGILNPSEHRTFAGIGFAVPIDQATGGGGSSPF